MAPARKIRPPSSRYSKRQSTDHSPSTVATGTAVHRPSATTRQSIPPTTVTEPPKTQQQNAYFRTKPIPCTSSSTRNDENNNSNSNSRHNSRKRPFFDETSKDTDSSLATSDVQSSSSTPPKFDSSQVIHDPEHYMFKIRLGSNGNIGKRLGKESVGWEILTCVSIYSGVVLSPYKVCNIGGILSYGKAKRRSECGTEVLFS